MTCRCDPFWRARIVWLFLFMLLLDQRKKTIKSCKMYGKVSKQKLNRLKEWNRGGNLKKKDFKRKRKHAFEKETK